MASSSDKGVCERIAQVRLELTGPRGKAKFAKQIGISPSTYDYYESSRIPPADILVRIAEVAGVDLHWLLTGQASGGRAIAPGHPVLQRAAALLADRPDAAAPLAAFVELLSEVQAVTADQPTQADSAEAATAAGGTATSPSQSDGPQLAEPVGRAAGEGGGDGQTTTVGLIPVLGRSAAGVPQFWSQGADAGVTELAALIGRHAGASAQRVQAAVLSDAEGQTKAQIVTLRDPGPDEVAQFVRADAIASRYVDAFALLIDGNSMAPEITHGDLVILSPSVAAANGRGAVVQIAGQIGVTCKLFRRSGEDIHLVPISEELAPITIRAEQLVWALRIIGNVRPDPSRPIN